MDDGIKGDAQAIGVGAPPRNPVQKRPTTSPAKHRFNPASVELEPQWFEEDVIDTGGVLPAGLAPHGGGDEAVPEPPSTVPAYMKKVGKKNAAEGSNGHQEVDDAASSSGGRRGRRSRQRGAVGSNAASRVNSTLLQKQLATRTRKVKSAPPSGPGGPKLSAASTELSSFALDLNGTRSGVKRYPYFG